MRSFYNFGVLEALPPPGWAVLCPPPGDSNPPPVPPACKLWTTRPAARLRLFKIRFCTYPERVAATDQNNRPRRGGSVRPLCGSVRRLSGLPCLGYSPINPGAVPGLCGGMEGREKGKRKAAHGGAALALFIHFQKLCKDNNGKSDNAKDNQHISTPLHENKPFRRGGFGKPISNGGGVLFQCGCVNAG